MQSDQVYHTPQYAAALDTLSKTPVIELTKFIAFTASIFDLSNDQVLIDVIAWTEPALCPLCNEPSISGAVHKACSDHEQMTADMRGAA